MSVQTPPTTQNDLDAEDSDHIMADSEPLSSSSLATAAASGNGLPSHINSNSNSNSNSSNNNSSSAVASSAPTNLPSTSPTLTKKTADGQAAAAAAGQREYENDKRFGAPGSAWNTKKYLEEYQRMADQLLDQDFNGNKYGDPLMWENE